jgi:hypothetical protein
MADQCFSMVRGRVMRATRLDGCGRVKASGCSAIVSEGFVSVAFTANIDEGEEITVTNASGKTCVRDTPVPRLSNYTLVITFCEVSPELYAMLTGQSVVFNANGDAVGFRVNTDVDPSDSGFALEVWSNVPGVTCGSAIDQGTYGYTLVPFVQGGVLGDFTIENNAVTFTISNATTKSGGSWSSGPYDVVAGAGTDEVQTVTVTGSPTGGNYTLTFDSVTTANIAYNANAAAIQSALEALSNVEPGDITVTGSGPFTLTFGGQYDDTNVPQITATAALTGGTSPGITTATTTQGAVGTATGLLEPIGSADHLHVQLTTIAPPSPGCACSASGPAATGATAGDPGTWTPTDSYPPFDFAELAASSITASPSSAWTTGQFVVLEDDSHAYWDGADWVAGEAP